MPIGGSYTIFLPKGMEIGARVSGDKCSLEIELYKNYRSDFITISCCDREQLEELFDCIEESGKEF